MKREKDAGRDPGSKVNRIQGGRAFQIEGPMVEEALFWAIVVLTRRIMVIQNDVHKL